MSKVIIAVIFIAFFAMIFIFSVPEVGDPKAIMGAHGSVRGYESHDLLDVVGSWFMGILFIIGVVGVAWNEIIKK